MTQSRETVEMEVVSTEPCSVEALAERKMNRYPFWGDKQIVSDARDEIFAVCANRDVEERICRTIGGMCPIADKKGLEWEALAQA